MKKLLYYLFIAMLFFNFSFGQTVIYQQNFDGNNGAFTNQFVVPSGTNGVFSNTTAVQANPFRHLWSVDNRGSGNFAPISGRSLGIGIYNDITPFYTNSPFRTYNGATCGILPNTRRWAFIPISTEGFQDIQVEFKWRLTGEVFNGVIYDYGTFMTSINGGANWLMDESGGTGGGVAFNPNNGGTISYSGGIYHSQSTVQTEIINLPASRNDQTGFAIAFRMVLDDCYGTGGGFIVDDIIVRGTPISVSPPPVCSDLLEPLDGTNEVSTVQNLSWQASANADEYDVYFGTSTIPPQIATTTATSYELPTLDNNTTYYWQIVPKNASGEAEDCDIWSFTTLDQAPILLSTGGSSQLTFNNSRIQTNQPTFRVEHPSTLSEIQLQINQDVTFSQPNVFNGTFSGNFSGANNFTTEPILALTNNETYYVRVRGENTDWSQDTFSFTYTPSSELKWFQTAMPQFGTDDVQGLGVFESIDRVSLLDGNLIPGVIANPSFEINNSDWSAFATGGSEIVINTWDGSNWTSEGNRAARMFMFGGFALSSDIGIISQTVDLTDVEQIIFDVSSIYGQNLGSNLTNGGTLRLIVGGSLNNTSGNVYSTISHCTTGNTGSCFNETFDIVANIAPADRIQNQVIKFVWTGFTQGGLGGALVDFQIDNIRTSTASTNEGTIISSPINLASFQNGESWDEIFWEQTLNNGTLELSVEKFNGTSWEAVNDLTNISETTDGTFTYDISAAGNESVIRLKADFTRNGAPELFSWGVTASSELLPVSWLNVSATCLDKNIKVEWSTATEINNDYFEVFASENGIDFQNIGKINGAGNSNTINRYAFLAEKQNSYNYFKVKQTDFDGQFEYSRIATANCSNFSNELEIYPNPFDGSVFYINYAEEIRDLTIKIYDLSGKLVDIPKTVQTNENIQVNLSNYLAAGTYLVELSNNQGFVAMKKLMTK